MGEEGGGFSGTIRTHGQNQGGGGDQGSEVGMAGEGGGGRKLYLNNNKIFQKPIS